MTCPFLSETRVRTCSAAPARKLIAVTAQTNPVEKCGDGRHRECAVFEEKGGSPEGACPYLEERPVQFCTAVPAPRYVPYSSAAVTPCGTEAYRFCEAYRALAGIQSELEEVAEGVTVVERLHYTGNHMWLNTGKSGLCHIGIDALLARFVGSVERVTMLAERGVRKPAAVLRVSGTDWPVVFPCAVLVESAATRLRANPAPVTEDPYGAGWLFSGWIPPGATLDAMTRHMVTGRRAAAWMRQEAQRLAERLIAMTAAPVGGVNVAADGGSLIHGAAAALNREQLLGLLNEFFPNHADSGWER